MADYEIFELGDVVLQSGQTLRGAKLAYKTYGKLNAAKDNVIVYPDLVFGHALENEWLIGEGMALDPAKYFIIIPNMFGNGLSSSPSNTPAPYNGARFPNITAYDNVSHAAPAGHREVRHQERQAGDRLVDGRAADLSLGRVFPDMVERILPFHGLGASARGTISSSSKASRPRCRPTPPSTTAGTRSRRPRACAPRPASMPAGASRRPSIASKDRDLEEMGYASLEDFLVGFWEGLASLPRTPTTC